MVSVIVLTYNHEKYIRQALDSILMQRVGFQYEILVGDDASTDSTQEILKEYDRNYPGKFRLFLRENNLGPTKNSYELLVSAKGDYLATCEGDDYWLDADKLQKQVNFMRAHDEFVACFHDCLLIGEDGQALRKQKISWISEKQVFTIKDFKGYLLPGQPSTMLRRNLYKDGVVDAAFFRDASAFIGDRTTIVSYLLHGSMFHMKAVLSCYRIKSENGVTKALYSGKAESLARDYSYTKKLEEYCCAQGMKADFRYHIQDLFVSAFYYAAFRKSEAAGNLLRLIVRNEDGVWRFFINLPIGMAKKVFRRFIFADY